MASTPSPLAFHAFPPCVQLQSPVAASGPRVNRPRRASLRSLSTWCAAPPLWAAHRTLPATRRTLQVYLKALPVDPDAFPPCLALTAAADAPEASAADPRTPALPPLPPSVGWVTDAATGTPVLVIGVMHGMPASVADVASVVAAGAGGFRTPAAVVLELCGGRYAALCGREARHSAPVVGLPDAEGSAPPPGTAGAPGTSHAARVRLELQPPLPPLPTAAVGASTPAGAAAGVATVDAGAAVPPSPPSASPAARFGRVVVRFGGVGAALFAIGLSSLTGMQQAAGMDPGCEFKVAARLAGEASVTVRRLYAAFSPRAAIKHFRSDAAEALTRLRVRPAHGVSLVGVFGRPRYAADVGRLLIPTVTASIVVQLAATAVLGGVLGQLFGGGAPAAADAVVAAAASTFTSPVAAAFESISMGAGFVANAWLVGTTLRFLNTLVTERDAVLYGSLQGTVAAVSDDGEGGGDAGDVRPVGTWTGGAGEVAVVGLLHVNGILRRWEAANAAWEEAQAMAPTLASGTGNSDVTGVST